MIRSISIQSDRSIDCNHYHDNHDIDTSLVDLEIIVDGSSSSSSSSSLVVEIGNDFATLLWESSLVLSWYLINVEFAGCTDCLIHRQQQEHRNNNSNNRIIRTIEIGAGIALPSLVACSLGASVIITDREGSTTNSIFQGINSNIQHNQQRSLKGRIPPTLIELSYGIFSNEVLSLPPVDYLFASDLFYNNTKDYDDIFATLSYFININPNIIILLCYQIRSVQKTISHYLYKWGMIGESILIDFLPIDQELRSEIELFKITSAKVSETNMSSTSIVVEDSGSD
ncbi:hypothetical protein PPL_05403 [Heterostelium album PN500]|uniref:Uncharacterized protein n=1 Tax=Heterostelium pallidum (strain ATCC 26659 / Pp 5 / PN500) TaxID=670386 RepID=D3BA30_HETP5|nr:hypothetical protein PPL_05403 [Heterostelium album PN500]EFA81417.1 hypothetical protein PPL_05403 [Heterostelium album PN500]|eukprot:XP_020433535.1 hypothetical protein PPL_05403 [Heterostelium album PN500]